MTKNAINNSKRTGFPHSLFAIPCFLACIGIFQTLSEKSQINGFLAEEKAIAMELAKRPGRC